MTSAVNAEIGPDGLLGRNGDLDASLEPLEAVLGYRFRGNVPALVCTSNIAPPVPCLRSRPQDFTDGAMPPKRGLTRRPVSSLPRQMRTGRLALADVAFTHASHVQAAEPSVRANSRDAALPTARL